MGVSMYLSVCVVCEQILVIEYEDVLKVGTISMSPPATCTSKTSCSLCCGDVAREVGNVCVCINYQN